MLLINHPHPCCYETRVEENKNGAFEKEKEIDCICVILALVICDRIG